MCKFLNNQNRNLCVFPSVWQLVPHSNLAAKTWHSCFLFTSFVRNSLKSYGFLVACLARTDIFSEVPRINLSCTFYWIGMTAIIQENEISLGYHLFKYSKTYTSPQVGGRLSSIWNKGILSWIKRAFLGYSKSSKETSYSWQITIMPIQSGYTKYGRGTSEKIILAGPAQWSHMT